MTGHYDIPDGWMPSVLVRSPNLGQPQIVDWTRREPIHLLMALADPETNLRSVLDQRLFLQPLPDTRRLVQDAKTGSPSLGDARISDCPRFIPLTVRDVGEVTASTWRWGRGTRLTTYPCACRVSCDLPDRLPGCAGAGQLFNVVQCFPEAAWANVNFHAAYLVDHDWQDFTISQISDTHISWRNDTICRVLEPRFPGVRNRFVNFNQNLRDFIRYANARHRTGALDAIVLTGDVIDYIQDNFNQRIGRNRAKDLGAEPYGQAPIDNFELFRDLIVAWPSHPGVLVGEELEVPLFTIPGNHDYRRNEYPLIHRLEIEVAGIDLSSLHPDPIREYSTFDLTEDEACAYEGGLLGIDDDRAASFIDHETSLPLSYAMIINPDADYRVALGPHSLVGLDTGHDDGVVTEIMEYLVRRGSGKMFVAGSPNSVGFSDGQIRFVRQQVEDTRGLLFLLCHAPLLNFHHTPHHFLRESEHQRTYTQDEQDELIAALLSNHPEATELEQYWPLAAGGANALVTGDPISSGIVVGISYLVKWLGGSKDSPADRLKKRGWHLGGTRFMKVGDRDDLIGWGVVANRFGPFVQAIESRVTQGKTASLVLSGHTHQAIEFVVTCRGNDGRIRLYHDYYLDNTIHGRRPQDYWRSVALPDAEEVTDPTVSWHHKSPLLVQTIALGPKPAGQMPLHAAAMPYGKARVTAGRFALYDLPPGTYVARYIAGDRSVSARGAIDIGTIKGACGSSAITWDLVPKKGVVPPLTGVDHPAEAFATRDLGTGTDVVVDGWLKPRPGGQGASGTLYLARALEPRGGCLEVEVVNGEIAATRRVSLSVMPLEQVPERADINVAAALGISMP